MFISFSKEIPNYFYYFYLLPGLNRWTYTLITIYFGLGSLLSLRGCYYYTNRGNGDEHFDAENGKGQDQNQDHLVRREAGYLAYFFQIIFQVNLTQLCFLM